MGNLTPGVADSGSSGGDVNVTEINGNTVLTAVNGLQAVALNNGTNTADVVAGDAGFNGVATASASKTYTFTTSSSGAQTLLAGTSCEGYSSLTIVFTSVGTGLGINGQFCETSGGTYYNAINNSWVNNNSLSANGIYSAINVPNTTRIISNYFQLQITALTSGTLSGYVVLSSTNAPLPSIQAGTWTVGSNSATGSAFPANAFGQGVKALTASPAAATTGNLVAVMGNTMGMPVIASALLNSPIAVSASITVVKNAPGYLSGVLVTSAGTSTAMTFYDNASAASGTIIGIVPASATAGTFWPFNMPALVGITSSGSPTNPAVTVALS